MLAGYKTYIVAALMVLVGAVEWLGAGGENVAALDSIMTHARVILEGLGLAALRAGVGSVGR